MNSLKTQFTKQRFNRVYWIQTKYFKQERKIEIEFGIWNIIKNRKKLVTLNLKIYKNFWVELLWVEFFIVKIFLPQDFTQALSSLVDALQWREICPLYRALEAHLKKLEVRGFEEAWSPLIWRSLKFADLKKLEVHIFEAVWNLLKIDLSSCMSCPRELSILPPKFENFEIQTDSIKTYTS